MLKWCIDLADTDTPHRYRSIPFHPAWSVRLTYSDVDTRYYWKLTPNIFRSIYSSTSLKHVLITDLQL